MDEESGASAFLAYVVIAALVLVGFAYWLWEIADVGELCVPGPDIVCDPADHPSRFRIQTFVTAVGAVAVFGAGYFTYRRARAADKQAVVANKQVEQLSRQVDTANTQAHHLGEQVKVQAHQTRHLGEQVKVANRQIDQQREEHATERYGRAIEQLGHNRIEVRIGGLYALEALAVDSADRWAATVYENLVAYLKEHTRPDPDHPEDVEIPTISTDVQAVLSVLSRRRPLFDNHLEILSKDNSTQFSNTPPPTSGVHLVGVDLRSAWLTGANFGGATLTTTLFDGATLTTTYFDGATLTNTRFGEATLTDTRFGEATLTDTCFGEATLTNTSFDGATLTNTRFGKATLTNTSFDGATLTNTRFGKATLTDTSFGEATLTDTYFGASADQSTLDQLEKMGVSPLPSLMVDEAET